VKKHHSWKIITIGLLFVVALQACQKKTSVLLEDTTCKYPCWHNIDPGVTSGMGVIQILSKLQFVDSPPTSAAETIPGSMSFTSWVFKEGFNEGGASVAFRNDKVVYIIFDNIYQIQVRDLIEQFGEPEIISAISHGQGARWLKISWVYPNQGVIFTFWNGNWRSKDNVYNITPSMPVDQVIYFQPGALDSIMVDLFEQWDKEIILESFQSWVGYGPILVSNPSDPYGFDK
jgi:hypothetical protein